MRCLICGGTFPTNCFAGYCMKTCPVRNMVDSIEVVKIWWDMYYYQSLVISFSVELLTSMEHIFDGCIYVEEEMGDSD